MALGSGSGNLCAHPHDQEIRFHPRPLYAVSLFALFVNNYTDSYGILTINTSLHRQSGTVYNSILWLQHDLTDEASKSRKSIDMIRRMHDNVYELMIRLAQENASLKPRNGTVWVSQKEFVLIQSGYIMLALLHPEACGISATEYERIVDAQIYGWYCLGHLFGIRDEFNSCLGSREEVIELFRLMERDEFLPIIRSTVDADQQIVQMSKVMADHILVSLKDFSSLVDGPMLHQYLAGVTISGNVHVVSLGLTQHLRLSLIKFATAYVIPLIPGAKALIGRYLLYKVDQMMAKRQEIHTSLKLKHPHLLLDASRMFPKET